MTVSKRLREHLDARNLKYVVVSHSPAFTAQEIAAAMRGYAELGVQHIMFQCEPYTLEARQRLTEALQLYRGTEWKTGTPLNMKPSDNTK